jgi:hypothetical protein
MHVRPVTVTVTIVLCVIILGTFAEVTKPMRTIHKFVIPSNRGTISAPKHIKPLRFTEGGILWMEVYVDEKENVRVPYVIIKTGEGLPDNVEPFVWTYVGSVNEQHLYLGR